MSLSFRDIEQVGDDEQFLISGKELKSLLEVTQQVRCGPDRLHYNWGGQLSRIVCSAKRAPDYEGLVKHIKERTNNGNA